MYVFTYGTLKKGFYNHYWMNEINAHFVGEGITDKIFTMVSVHDYYPGLIGGNMAVSGEVYEINDSSIAHLDKLEGYPKLYDRKEINVKVGNKVLRALVYVLNVNDGFPTESDYIKTSNNGVLTWINDEDEDNEY